MKIKLAKTSGFCIGVKNAVLRIIKEINSAEENILIYGPLIHNPQTIDILSERGLTTIKDLRDINDRPIAIRTHGVPMHEKTIIEKNSKRIIDLTCPRVIKVQKIIEKHSAEGFFTIITGDRDHAEVIGLKSYAAGGVFVISSPEDIDQIPRADRYVLVSQTTFDQFQFENIKNRLTEKLPGIRIYDTICSSTHNRQDEILKEIRGGTDAVVVIGGRDSANTRRLASICSAKGIRTFHVENESELKGEDLSGAKNVLVTAGASTPGWIINNVLEKLEMINTENKNILVRLISRLSVFIARTNIIQAFGAFFMSLFAQKYLSGKQEFYPALISALYVFSAMTIADLYDIELIKRIIPRKFSLLSANRRGLLLAASLSGALCLSLSFKFSAAAVIIASAAAIAVLPRIFLSVKNKARQTGEKPAPPGAAISLVSEHFYGLKNITDALGWTLASAFIPLTINSDDILNAWPPIVFIFCMIFIRNLILDIITFQGDMILGRKTIPVLSGSGKTRMISLFSAAAALASLAALSCGTKDISILLYSINIIFYLTIILYIADKEYLVPLRYEVLAEMNLLIFIFIFIMK